MSEQTKNFGEVRKNLNEVVQVFNSQFEGRAYTSLRVFLKAEGESGPGKATYRGVTMRPETAAAVAPLLAEAAAAALKDAGAGADAGVPAPGQRADHGWPGDNGADRDGQ